MEESRAASKKRVYRGTMLAIVLMLFCMAVGAYYIHYYDEGVLAVYARQQDSFTQLVLDQINLLGENASSDDITAILNTMDSSNQRYWTLSEDDKLIFVKNVQETNRYKGFSTATFFASKAGLSFLEDMKLNYVSHEIIKLDGERYVVSGTVFRFQGADYTMCLMTDVNVVLQENTFLSAKIILYAVLIMMLVIAGIALISLTDNVRKRLVELESMDDQALRFNQTIEKLNHRINKNDMFHPRWNLYRQSMIESFIIGFEEKGVEKMSFGLLEFRSEEHRNAFLEDALVFLDKNTLRFQMDGNDDRIFLLFVGIGKEEALQNFNRFYLRTEEEKGVAGWEKGEEPAISVANRFYESITGDILCE
ncbi:MAG: hypothetical protein K6A69_02665 [Lachnospiraceae bacterium]|nr:hypothetical protein [Lachnospiraceae bacterium]